MPISQGLCRTFSYILYEISKGSLGGEQRRFVIPIIFVHRNLFKKDPPGSCMSNTRLWIAGGDETLKHSSHLGYYLFAGFCGIAIFLLMLGGFKIIAYLLGALFHYWMFVVGGIVVLLILRKILMRKQLKLVK